MDIVPTVCTLSRRRYSLLISFNCSIAISVGACTLAIVRLPCFCIFALLFRAAIIFATWLGGFTLGVVLNLYKIFKVVIIFVAYTPVIIFIESWISFFQDRDCLIQ